MAFLRQIPSYFLLERPAHQRELPQLLEMLIAEGMRINQRMRACERNDGNHKQATHIIGMEKWSQHRLRVATGAAFRDEEYTVHRPPQDTRWDDMNDLYKATRDETIKIVEHFPAGNLEQKIRHNQFGEITARAWIFYIHTHAMLESKRLK